MGESKVQAWNRSQTISKETLMELANHPDLEHFMIVCFWDDNEVTCGWTADISHSSLVFGSKQLDQEVIDQVFPHRHQPEDTDYS